MRPLAGSVHCDVHLRVLVGMALTEGGQIHVFEIDFRDLALLKGFIDGNHISKATGLLPKDIDLDRRPRTIKRRVSRLEAKGYVARGFRISGADTFYITQEGIEFYQEAIR